LSGLQQEGLIVVQQRFIGIVDSANLKRVIGRGLD